RNLEGFTETQRWQTLTALQQKYLSTLDGLKLWDRQTARRFAIQHDECELRKPLVLIGAVDLNQAMRMMLDQVAKKAPEAVTALIYAPAEWRKRFDSHGCLAPDVWQEAELSIPDEIVVEADDPADQADTVARQLADAAEFRPEDITVGLPDERILPMVMRQLDECEVPNRYGPGRSVGSTSVCRLLSNLAEWIETNRYPEFAAVVRHPDMEQWLLRDGVRPGWLEALDDYYNSHLPTAIGGDWLGDAARTDGLRDVESHIKRLLKGLRGGPRPLSEWLPSIGKLLLKIYGERDFDLENEADRVRWMAIQCVQKSLQHLVRLPSELTPNVSASEAIEFVLDQVSGERIAPKNAEAAVELVGWLELSLDDAPRLIVTSFNEGFVPSSMNADLFLPGALRTALGLEDNARRYARDAYALSTLLSPWRETTLIVGRRTEDDDPLAPSRLLFAADPDVLARRALRFFSPLESKLDRRPLAGGLRATRRDLGFDVPRPQDTEEPLEHLRVTAFAAYLACPYRFYLSQVLGFRSASDDATELDGAAFGSLAHTVLEEFASSDERESTDADRIRLCFEHLLARQVARQFGEHPGPAIRIQVQQLRLRLAALAEWQAERAVQGWRIEHAELAFSRKSDERPEIRRPGELLVDGRIMYLTGRIDRIDVNVNTGQRQILDYKTSDSGLKPQQTHRHKHEWVDLQLPLYRHLARSLGIDEPVGLGYVLLPKNSANVGLALAEWSAEELAEADRMAQQVVRQIRAGEFWPPKEPPPKFSEELAFICMDGVFGRKRFEPVG
ncbi:MAG: PD-(D/E)XK nuclease family protein, partial [Planctomycetales bacterium]|nr:PD-(D/E)XK nuclease family protein [Planctomycetales bacterium]